MSDLLFREGTQDRDIWMTVFDCDEYGLRGMTLTAEDVVLDIGAHIGSFTYAALNRGAGRVFAVEADAGNAGVFRHNLHTVCDASCRAHLINGAAWRSDVPPGQLLYFANVGANTGGGNVLGESGAGVRAFSFDSLVRFAASSSASGRVKLCKIDCEGSEWPILLTSQCLHLVDELVGEYHVITNLDAWPQAKISPWTKYDADTMRWILGNAGFDYTIRPTSGEWEQGQLGLFSATRPHGV